MSLPHYHHGNLKDALLQYGQECLDETGAEAFSLRDVARRAGVSHNAPYRHFADKTGLLLEIQKKIASDFANEIESVLLLYPTSALLQLQAIGHFFSEYARLHPQRLMILTQPIAHLTEPAGPQEDLIYSALLYVTEANIQSGLLSSPNPQHLAQTLQCALDGYATLLNSERFSQFDDIAENLLRGFLPRS